MIIIFLKLFINVLLYIKLLVCMIKLYLFKPIYLKGLRHNNNDDKNNTKLIL